MSNSCRKFFSFKVVIIDCLSHMKGVEKQIGVSIKSVMPGNSYKFTIGIFFPLCTRFVLLPLKLES